MAALNIDDAADMFGGMADYTQNAYTSNDILSDDGGDSIGGDDEDQNEVALLRQFWVNEVASPSLLPIDVDLVECMTLLLKNQVAVIDQLEENVGGEAKDGRSEGREARNDGTTGAKRHQKKHTAYPHNSSPSARRFAPRLQIPCLPFN